MKQAIQIQNQEIEIVTKSGEFGISTLLFFNGENASLSKFKSTNWYLKDSDDTKRFIGYMTDEEAQKIQNTMKEQTRQFQNEMNNGKQKDNRSVESIQIDRKMAIEKDGKRMWAENGEYA